MGQLAKAVPFFVLLCLTLGRVTNSLKSLREMGFHRGLRTKYKE